MNKYDWLELATRVLGVWFVASGAIQVLQTISMRSAVPAEFLGRMNVAGVSGASFFAAVGTSFLGTLMVLLAPGFIAWLKKNDARARVPQQRTSSGTTASAEAN